MPLRFPPQTIPEIAARYHYEREPELIALVPVVQRQGFLNREQLFTVCRWKSPRQAARAHDNSDLFVQEVTRFALAAHDERSRIEPLCMLDGVGWPTASTILHWFHQAPYPIVDFRALWSLQMQAHTYDFPFWQGYIGHWRAILQEAQELLGHAITTPRMFDRALWQYSYENQP